MKLNYGRLFVDLLLLAIVPVVLLIITVGTWMDVRDLHSKLNENKQEAIENLGEYEWETSVVLYILDIEYDVEVNQKLNTLAYSYVFLGIMEAIIFAFVFKNFKNERYIEVL